mgnify:CR=1 FL=1
MQRNVFFFKNRIYYNYFCVYDTPPLRFSFEQHFHLLLGLSFITNNCCNYYYYYYYYFTIEDFCSRSDSKPSTPRVKPDSPLSARNKAIEDEIEQLVQAARLRNQSARRHAAEATPIKMIDKFLHAPSQPGGGSKSPTVQSVYEILFLCYLIF